MDNDSKLNENLVMDLDSIKRFVFEEDSNTSKTHDNEITETYAEDEEGKMTLLNRVIHEVKGSDFSNKESIRYDLIKTFLSMLDAMEINNDITPMSFGQRIVLNTMINYGLIKEINSNE